jgi:probable F420-dependent oxidoreductase
MTEVAGEVADGLIVHPFNNPRFLREQALPAVQRGLASAERRREAFTLQINAIVVTGVTDQQRDAARAAVRSLLGFYASTPAYLPPMAAMGFGDLQPELNRLSKSGDWEALGEHIDDDFMEAFATSGHPGDIAAALLGRYGDCADRLALYAPYDAPDAMWREIVQDLKRLQAPC